jgi:hypothetical protein
MGSNFDRDLQGYVLQQGKYSDEQLVLQSAGLSEANFVPCTARLSATPLSAKPKCHAVE